MKKLVLFFLLAIIAISCEPGTEGPQGPQGEGMNWFIETYTVEKSAWELVESPTGQYYSYTFPERAITDFVYTDGNVDGYIELYLEELKNKVQTPLPFVQHVNGGSKDLDWTETYTFDFRPGFITFNVRYSDFEMTAPPTCKFKIAVNW